MACATATGMAEAQIFDQDRYFKGLVAGRD